MHVSSNFYSNTYTKVSGTSDGTTEKVDKSTGQSARSAEAEFLEYMKKTPAQRMFDSWLARHKISSEQFNAMSPEEKKKLLDQFKQEMQEELRRKYGTSSFGGSVVNATA